MLNDLSTATRKAIIQAGVEILFIDMQNLGWRKTIKVR